MRKIWYFGVFVLLLMAASCKNSGGPSISDSEKAEIQQQVKARWDQLIQTVEKSDATGYNQFFAGNEFAGMTSQGVAFPDWKTYGDSVSWWFGQRNSAQLEEKDLKIHVLSRRLAMVDQKCRFVASYKNGQQENIHHVATFLFQRQNDDWKIIFGHESWRP